MIHAFFKHIVTRNEFMPAIEAMCSPEPEIFYGMAMAFAWHWVVLGLVNASGMWYQNDLYCSINHYRQDAIRSLAEIRVS
jgi:hypothetical protein